MSSSVIEKLLWRYSVKLFDSDRKLSENQLENVLESMRLSASSFGLQPWKFLVITNPALRTELQKHAWNQVQVTTCSHLIVLCAKKEMNLEDVRVYIEDVAKTRGVSLDSLVGYRKMMEGFVSSQTKEQQSAWIKNQIYIVLGSLLTFCAMEGIDACPMEGFSPKDFDQILGLDKKGLTTTVLCPIGYRSPQDPYAKAAKVRFPKGELFEFLD